MKHLPDIGAIVIITGWLTGLINNLSPIISFLTVCGGFIIMIVSLYVKCKQAREYFKKRKR